jgi:hypothetical protein
LVLVLVPVPTILVVPTHLSVPAYFFNTSTADTGTAAGINRGGNNSNNNNKEEEEEQEKESRLIGKYAPDSTASIVKMPQQD